MNLATRIAYIADRRLIRARRVARARVTLRRYGLALMVVAVALVTRVGQEARHADEVAQLRAEVVQAHRKLRALEDLPDPVAIVLTASSRGALKLQLATIAGKLDGVRDDLRQTP
jgi:hypothetical protein